MKLLSLANRLRSDERGAVAVMFGVSVVVLFSVVGLAIDSSRVYNVRSKMLAALDAAALAAAKLLDDEDATQADFQATAESYVNSFMRRVHVDHVNWSNVRADVDPAVGSVTVTADVSMPALFGNVSAGISNFNFSPSARVIYKPRKIEVAMVLDITGSMCNMAPSDPADACSAGTKLDGLKDAARSLVDALAATYPPRGAVRVSVVPYSAAVNAGSYAGTASAGASVDGCVVERTGGSAYSDDSPYTSALGTSSVAQNVSYSCPSSPVLPLTDVSDSSGRSTISASIDGMRGYGGTAGHLGAAWGWYTLSPKWASVWPSASEPRAYDKDKTVKVLVLMTDGMFNTAYRNGGENYVWPDSSTSDKTKPGTSSYQALEICESVRNLNGEVQLFTIGFQTPPEAETILKECAGEANFRAAESAQDLIQSFKDIASKISSMRVSG